MAINDVKMKIFKITEEDLVEQNFFREGVHEVIITSAEFFETDDQKIYLELGIMGSNDEQDTARLYFTDGAKKISLDTIRKILVHNAPDEETKDKIREAYKKITNLAQLNPFVLRLVDKQAWLKIEKSDKTYTSKETGEIKHSYNRNIYGFEPKMKTTPSESKTNTQGNTVSKPTAEQVAQVEAAVDALPEQDDIDLTDIPF
jgi:hypothetical protein